MKATEAYTDLKKRMREIAILRSTEGVLWWDQEAYLPERGSDHRAEQTAQLNRIAHEWFTDPRVGEWIGLIEESELVADPESDAAVNVREWRRHYDRETKLPGDLVAEFARVTSKASAVWAEARKRSDFGAFKPHLQEIIELCRKKADLIGFTTEPYDALLDEFEPGAKAADIEAVFAGLRSDLTELVGKIANAPSKPNIALLRQPYDPARQRVFAEAVGSAIGFNFRAGRFDKAVHPSCNNLGPWDIRILTRYYPDDFCEGLTASMHEVGHALYDLTQIDDEHWGTPRGETDSLGIHESQSRLWENMVGRSREFWVYFFPQMKRFFPAQTGGATVDDVYGAMNYVAPSFIRVEADEATYNLHVMLRFELERAIIEGDLAVADIPAEWNRRFHDYLGIEVDCDANGCLQDVHWSHGIFGYFPTYALGNLYAAQFWRQAQRDLPTMKQDLAQGTFGPLREWLGENIHRQGSKYLAADLCRRLTGEPLSSRPLLDYLYEKYAEIYDVSRG